MEPQLLGVIGGAVAMGLAGGKLIDNVWMRYDNKGNGNGKVELLLERLVKLAEEDQKTSGQQSEGLRTLLREMERHSTHEEQANKDIFKLLRGA